MRRLDIAQIYFSGLFELVLTCFGFAAATLVILQSLAFTMGFLVDAESVLLLCWQAFMLLALWPGQQFWTIRRTTTDGHEHSIIGTPTDDDLRAHNHRIAQRWCRHRQD